MVVLRVDTESFAEASAQARSVALLVGRAMSRAVSGFGGLSQMAGSDPNGLKWAASYDQACGQLMTYAAQLQDAVSTVSRKLAVTGYCYEVVELTNAGVTNVGLALPSPVVATSCPYIPSAAGGERKFPGPVPGMEWVAEQIANLVGNMWPDGDTAKLDEASRVWHRLADDLDDVASTVSKVPQALSGVNTPELSRIEDEVHRVRTFAKQVASACRELATACTALSGKISYVHVQTEITVGVTIGVIAATVAAALGLTVFTFGISDAVGVAGVAGETAGAVATIGGFIAELGASISAAVGGIAASTAGLVGISADLAATIGVTVGDITASAVLWGVAGAGENMLVTGVTQPDTGDLLGAAEEGFVGGALGGGIGAGLGKVFEFAGGSGKAVVSASGSDAVDSGLTDEMRKKIIAMEKGTRPEPETYLSPDYIAQHLAKFEDGAVRFTTEDKLHTHGVGHIDGTSFLMSKSEVDELVRKTNGDPRKLEEALGLPEDQLGKGALRIDFPSPLSHGGRIPSGNEAGANQKWEPGGHLPNGSSEIVIDVAGMKPGIDYYAAKIEVGN